VILYSVKGILQPKDKKKKTNKSLKKKNDFYSLGKTPDPSIGLFKNSLFKFLFFCVAVLRLHIRKAEGWDKADQKNENKSFFLYQQKTCQ